MPKRKKSGNLSYAPRILLSTKISEHSCSINKERTKSTSPIWLLLTSISMVILYFQADFNRTEFLTCTPPSLTPQFNNFTEPHPQEFLQPHYLTLERNTDLQRPYLLTHFSSYVCCHHQKEIKHFILSSTE